MKIPDLVRKLGTLADDVTPSLRKVLAMSIGALGILIGLAFVGLSIFSTLKTGAFDPSNYGVGASALLAALAALPLSLAKSMQLVPDRTEPPVEEPVA